MTTKGIGVPITAPITEADMRRFWAKVVIDPSGHLLWTANKGRGGYGQFGHAGRTVRAHRFAYTALVGPIPDGLTIDHLCQIKACVAPNCLEAVTNVENVLRGRPGTYNAVKDRCPAGHAYDVENTRFASDGHRSCRACERERNRARRNANRDAINAAERERRAGRREEVNAANRARYAARDQARREARNATDRVSDAARRARKVAEREALPKCGHVGRRGAACARPLGHDGKHQSRSAAAR